MIPKRQYDYLFVLSAQLGYSALRFVTVIFLAHLLTKDEMGQTMFGLNYTLVFIIVGTLGLDSAAVHFTARFKAEGALEQLRGFLQNALGVALIWGTLLSVCGIILAVLGFRLLTLWEITFFVFSVPFALVQMYGLGVLLGMHDLIGYGTLFVAQPALFLLLALARAGLGGLDVLSIGIALYISYVITSIVVIRRTALHIPNLFKAWRVRWAELRQQIGFSFFVYINLIGLFLDSRWPILVMGRLGQVEQIALYALATPITEASLQIARSVGLVLLAHASAGDLAARRVTRLVIFFYILVIILLMLLAPWIVPWLFGHDYTTAVLLIQVLAPGMIPLAAGILRVNFLTGLGRPQSGALAASLSFISMVLSSAVLIPLYNAVGAALATGLAYLVYWGSSVALSRKF
jgi:O-antigen/teichoic acid export membrane protein